MSIKKSICTINLNILKLFVITVKFCISLNKFRTIIIIIKCTFRSKCIYEIEIQSNIKFYEHNHIAPFKINL